jgi:outer membrane protein
VGVSNKLAVIAVMSLMSVFAAAEAKIVALDAQAAVMSTTAAKAKFEKLYKTPEFAASKAKLDGLTADIKALQALFQKDGLTWTAEKRAENEKKLQGLVGDYQFEGKKLQTEQQALGQQIMQEMGPKLEATVKKLVDAEKITMIVDAKAIVLIKPESDLTSKVTELLNAQAN